MASRAISRLVAVIYPDRRFLATKEHKIVGRAQRGAERSGASFFRSDACVLGVYRSVEVPATISVVFS